MTSKYSTFTCTEVSDIIGDIAAKIDKRIKIEQSRLEFEPNYTAQEYLISLGSLESLKEISLIRNFVFIFDLQFI